MWPPFYVSLQHTEPKKIERFRFSLSEPCPLLSRMAAEPGQPGLVRVQRQFERAQSRVQVVQNGLCLVLMLKPDDLSSSGEEFHLSALRGGVEDWRAGLGRCLCSPLPRPFGCEVSQHLDRATFPVPAMSNAACGFPALRSPVCFASRFIGPILLGQLSAGGTELDSR